MFLDKIRKHPRIVAFIGLLVTAIACLELISEFTPKFAEPLLIVILLSGTGLSIYASIEASKKDDKK